MLNYRLLASLVASRKPGKVDYTEEFRALKEHMKPKPIKIAERFRFYKRSLKQYLAELRRLASTCEFHEFLNEALCDRLVCGLQEEGMQQRLLAKPKRALELSEGIEAAQKDCPQKTIWVR